MRTKFLFVFGFLLLGISILWYFNQTIQLAFFSPRTAYQQVDIKRPSKIPVHISIPAVGVNLDIEETAITNGIWQISGKGASHLNISARPDENGPIILYSHNTNERFGPIRWLSTGEMIEIRANDGKIHKYKISETLRVKPDRLDVLTKHKEETLVLYTCDGFADLERFVVVAKPLK